MIAVIVKAFGTHKPGELVETDGWRNGAALLKARHIRPAVTSELGQYEKGVRTIHLKATPAEGAKGRTKATAAA